MTSFELNSVIMSQICERIEPEKKTLQKLMYLIERRGVHLELKYSFHFFGPYSAKLDEIIHILEHYDKLTIDTSGVTHIIRKGTISIVGQLGEEEQKKVNLVLDYFANKSAFDLEAITTVDYVADTILKGSSNEVEIISRVKRIKGSRFSDICLVESFQTLQKFGYI